MPRLLTLTLLSTIIGCTSQTGPDSNVEVFRTPQQEAVARRAKMGQEWVNLALKINNAERADVKTIRHPNQPLALIASADSVERTIDLTPIAEKLSGNPGKEREPIRALLSSEMHQFDRARLTSMGFDQAKSLLYPLLANNRQLSELSKDPASPTLSRAIVGDLNWVPIIRWPGTEAWTPVDPGVVNSWYVAKDVVIDAAIGNLKRDYIADAEKSPVFDTTEFPGLGKYGSLRAGLNPGYALLPEFLTGVRRAWKTEDDLVLLLPARASITFVEKKNTPLLDRMLPEWEKRFTTFSDPLLMIPLVASDKGFELSNYKPTNKAATKPATGPATKPRVYIVN